MQNDFFFVFRVISAIAFLGMLGVGAWLGWNYQRLFGIDPAMPSESGSSRAYSQVQIFTLWAHAVVATGAFALCLH